MANPKPNALEALRIRRFEEIGCIACWIDGHRHEPYDVHHLVEGYRLGHRYSIPLCPWHHRGVAKSSEEKLLKGPSMFHKKRVFVATYGTERDLLARVDGMLGYPSPFVEAA